MINITKNNKKKPTQKQKKKTNIERKLLKIFSKIEEILQ